MEPQAPRAYVAVEITSFTDDSQPGWVECRLVDARGQAHRFVEKVPVVTEAALERGSSYPAPGVLGCEVVEERSEDGRTLLLIDTASPWGIESVTGQTRFVVLREQVTITTGP